MVARASTIQGLLILTLIGIITAVGSMAATLEDINAALQELMNRQAQLEQTLIQERQQRVSAERRLSDMATGASSSVSHVDTRLLGKPEKFDGSDQSTQLYYMLVLLTQHRALDRVQAAGEGEGGVAWRMLHEQWEPKTRSRWTSMLLGILNGKFRGEAQADIEHLERSVRLFEKQTSYNIPDSIKAGILINGLTEETLRSHMVMHAHREA